MRVRNYAPSDYPHVRAVLYEAGLFDESYDAKHKLDAKIPEGSIIVAIGGNEIVGVVFYTYDGWDSAIYRLAVREDRRKQGVGTLLLKEAEKRLMQKGADVSSLRVSVNNSEAQDFFRKRGYKIVGNYLDMEKKL